MSMEKTLVSGVMVLTPRYERLVAAQAELLRKTMQGCLQDSETGLVLDLESVHLLDSIILGVVVGVFRDSGQGKPLALCCASASVTSLFKLTHLDKILKPHATRQQAVAAVISLGRKQS